MKTDPERIIVVNGEPRNLPPGATVAALLEEHGLAKERVVVELNREVLRGDEVGRAPLAEGDRVEIVQFVGGG